MAYPSRISDDPPRDSEENFLALQIVPVQWQLRHKKIKILDSQPKVCLFVYETLLLTWPTTLPKDQG